MFEIANDKMYFFLFLAIGIVAFFLLGSWYVKSCIKDELDELKKDTRKKRVRKEDQFNKNRLMEEHLMKQRMMMQRQEPDMDSYVDPIGKEGDSNPQYQDLNIPYKSPGNGTSSDGILMRDIMDNKGMNNPS